MGFDPSLAIFMSGVGTLLFYFVTGGGIWLRKPSFTSSAW